MLKESDDLVILGVTFDSKMTFEKHLRSVSRTTSQSLGILRKSCRLFHDRSLLRRCFRAFVLPVLEYCSAVMSVDTHLKLLDRTVGGARFLTGGVFECDVAHRRSVAVLYMLYKIRCNPMHPLNGALPGPYVLVRVTCGALVCTSVYLCAALLLSLAVSQDQCPAVSVSRWNDLADPVFDVEDCWVSTAGLMFFFPQLLYRYYLPIFSPFSSFCLYVGILGLGSSIGPIR